jgi:hypothetical protein
MATHFVDHEEIGVGDARSPLTGNLVSTLGTDGINKAPGDVNCGYYRNVDNIDNKICQLSGIVCRKIVASALYKEQLAIELGLETFEGTNICGDILPDSGMRAPPSFDSLDTLRREGVVLDQEFLVLASEYVVGHNS